MIKSKLRECGLCHQSEPESLLRPLGKYTWILKGGKDIDVKSDIMVCSVCIKGLSNKTEEVRKVAKKLGVPPEYLQSVQPWLQEGRAPSEKEFTSWARGQHKRACNQYMAAYPLTYHNGKCSHMMLFNKPCASFFSNMGICETGYFVPERMKRLSWSDFNKQARRAGRQVKEQLY